MQELEIKDIFIKTKFCISVICCFMFFMFLFYNGQTKVYEDNFDNTNAIETVELTSIGYEIENGLYIPIEGDPQLILYVDYEKISEVHSLKVVFSEVLEDDTTIELYYIDTNEFYDESHCIRKICRKGEKEIVLGSINTKSSNIRLDINGIFSLETIVLSPNEVQKIEIANENSHIILFIMFDLVISIAISLVLKKYGRQTIIFLCGKYKQICLLFFVSIVPCIIIYIHRGYINYMKNIVYISLVTITLVLIFFRNKIERLECIFALICISIGISFAINLPMLQESTWDAAIHFVNTEKLSHIFDGIYYELEGTVGHLSYTYSLSSLRELYELYQSQMQESNIVYVGDINLYTYVGYLPAAFGMFVARGLGLGLFWVILFGKIFTLLTYVIVVYFAIKKMPVGKSVMALIALFPTSIMLASTYSYDSWVTCFLMLGLSYIIDGILTKNKKITNKEIMVILLSMFLGVGPKQVYIPLLLIAFLIPKEKFINKKQRLFLYFGIIMVFLLVSICILLPIITAGSMGEGDIRGGTDVNSNEQMLFILFQPISYLKILLNFLLKYWSPKNSLSYICYVAYNGTLQVADGNHYILGYPIIYCFVLIAIILEEKNGNNINIPLYVRVIIGTITFITSCLIATALYISFTPVRNETVMGVQGRYLIPLLGYAAVVFIQDKKTIISTNKRNILIASFIYIESLISLFGIYTQISCMYIK